jgi:hypothetical protein
VYKKDATPATAAAMGAAKTARSSRRRAQFFDFVHLSSENTHSSNIGLFLVGISEITAVSPAV